MSKTYVYIATAIALMTAAACGEGVTQPASEARVDLAIVANPRALRADFEASFCGGEPMVTNVQPGWPYIFGTDQDDQIVAGDAFAVRINARAGNDCLVGGNPNNSLFGEDGDDLMLGGGGDDYIDGGAGADVAFGDDGDDHIRADDGYPDIVFAGNGEDVVLAADGAVDEIDCGPGFDVAFADPDDILIRCEVVNPADPR